MFSNPFSYFDIVLLNYGCKRKNSAIKKVYERKMEIIKERMDLGNIVRRAEIVDTLASAVLKPYQIKLLNHHKNENYEKAKSSYKISQSDAV